MKGNLMGFVDGLTNEQYHSGPGISSTGLRELAKSPAHFKAYLESKKVQTPAMAFGATFHELIGEPGLFAEKYVKEPLGLDKRTKEGKEVYARFLEENAGRQIISVDDYDRMEGMLSSILNSKTSLDLMHGGKSEVSVYWKDKETGVLCKCRPDYLRADGIIIDLKTSEDATMQGFQKSISNYAYHIQSAFYLDGVSSAMNEPIDEFVHIVVEKKKPYGIGIFTLDDYSLHLARQEIKRLLRLYADCLEKDIWPSYEDKVQNVSLPSWMIK